MEKCIFSQGAGASAWFFHVDVKHRPSRASGKHLETFLILQPGVQLNKTEHMDSLNTYVCTLPKTAFTC